MSPQTIKLHEHPVHDGVHLEADDGQTWSLASSIGGRWLEEDARSWLAGDWQPAVIEGPP